MSLKKSRQKIDIMNVKCFKIRERWINGTERDIKFYESTLFKWYESILLKYYWEKKVLRYLENNQAGQRQPTRNENKNWQNDR